MNLDGGGLWCVWVSMHGFCERRGAGGMEEWGGGWQQGTTEDIDDDLKKVAVTLLALLCSSFL